MSCKEHLESGKSPEITLVSASASFMRPISQYGQLYAPGQSA
jgi:hypothetical protein